MDHRRAEHGTAEHADTERQGVVGAETWTGLGLGLGRGGGLPRLAGGRLRRRLLRGGRGDRRRRPRGLLLRESR
jgi:hypothetical protein